ncbi:MAG: glycosyltransferase family 1 protein [Desulfomonile tiedjei]|nr:glycosyltransferase family 1 protein [Desulfomonile tiedjei]
MGMGPRRVLHVVDGLERGGITTWLMNVLRHTSRDVLQMDFLVHTADPCSYDDEARALGSRILHCPYHRKPWLYARHFTRLVREYGPYDIVHSHCHRFSGLVLRLAYKEAVPVRIVHSHSDASAIVAEEGLFRRAYYSLMDHWIDKYGTVGFAASRSAAKDLFGENWESDGRWKTLFCGIDTTPFHHTYDRRAVREEIGLPSDAPVVGHVGRFTRAKNHMFLLEVFAHALRLEPRLRLILVGDGPEEEIVRQRAEQDDLRERVLFLGSRSDVPRLLLNCVDLFLFPSVFEGLGLALVEAQAAGLPCLVSEQVPREADLVPSLVRRLSLSHGPSEWAGQLLDLISAPPRLSFQEALAIVEQSPFNLSNSIRELQDAYTEQTAPGKKMEASAQSESCT